MKNANEHKFAYHTYCDISIQKRAQNIPMPFYFMTTSPNAHNFIVQCHIVIPKHVLKNASLTQ